MNYIAVKPRALKFGAIRVGKSKTERVRIRNRGNAGLAVTKIEVLPRDQFALVGTAFERL